MKLCILKLNKNVSMQVLSFLLQWQGKDTSSYPFEVTLLLLSFLISWIEAWFVDFRVLPQENRAKSVLEGKIIQKNNAYAY